MFTAAPDNFNLSRIINVPKRGIGAKTLDKLKSEAAEKKMTVFELVTSPDYSPKNKGVTDFRIAMQKLAEYSRSAEATLPQLISNIVNEVDYLSYLQTTVAKFDDPDAYEEKCRNVDELINKAAEFALEHRDMDLFTMLDAFLSEVALMTDQDKSKDLDKVTLMTMHRSKGLEFENVFVAGCEDEFLPGHVSLCCDASHSILQEERRLFYVAMTRAKKNLYLSFCNTRRYYGELLFTTPSRFLAEIIDQNVKCNKNASLAINKVIESIRENTGRAIVHAAQNRISFIP